ncbi:MAG: class I SAM-dependent methyltransferase, partial [Bacteroidetes bacterium]|nr:class I SAM-dependent methyltransferase [Bacteroidota bacterium]
QKIETIRRNLKKDTASIEVLDLGAGSINGKKNSRRRIADIAKSALKPSKQSQLLFRIVNYFNPSTILELGTSLGTSTAYLASAAPNSQIISLEGAPEIANIAQKNFNNLNIQNIQISVGDISKTLNPALEKLKKVDFVFFDANHKKKPTIDYFEQCLPFITNNSVFVFDDIHWSAEMEDAWNYIKQHQKTKVTIDLFYLGIVFFKNELQKQNFIIRQ